MLRYTSFIDECSYRIFGSDLIRGRAQYVLPCFSSYLFFSFLFYIFVYRIDDYHRYPCVNDSDCLTFCTIFKSCYVDYDNIDNITLDVRTLSLYYSYFPSVLFYCFSTLVSDTNMFAVSAVFDRSSHCKTVEIRLGATKQHL